MNTQQQLSKTQQDAILWEQVQYEKSVQARERVRRNLEAMGILRPKKIELVATPTGPKPA